MSMPLPKTGKNKGAIHQTLSARIPLDKYISFKFCPLPGSNTV